MKRTEKFYLFHIIRRNIYYFIIRIIRRFQRIFYLKKEHKFLFLLSPPYCGSTMLNQLLSSSRNVSCNNNLGTREGQLLPKIKKIMFDSDRWDNSVKYPWDEIKQIWMKYWNFSKTIFLEKSTPNIIRADEIDIIFSPAYYICFVRNPYAQVEGIMRRNKQDANTAAEFAIQCLEYQKKNKSRNNTLYFSYEQLCDNPEEIVLKLKRFLPELNDINYQIKFTSHNFKSSKAMRMVNLNQEKINKISYDDLKIINSVFCRRKDLLESFNYRIIER